MSAVQSTYLDWQSLVHAEACRRPRWEVDFREDDDGFRYQPRTADGPARHSCPDEDCDHDSRYTKLTVRVVCRSCGRAHLLTGEYHGQTHTTTARLGYGLPPRKVAGLWLWPGEPHLYVFREESAEPHDFLVTRPGAARVTKDTVVGQVTQWRGKRGGVMWTAAAVPSVDGPYGGGLGTIRWTQAQENFKTVAAAAKWIAAQLAEDSAPQGGEGR